MVVVVNLSVLADELGILNEILPVLLLAVLPSPGRGQVGVELGLGGLDRVLLGTVLESGFQGRLRVR